MPKISDGKIGVREFGALIIISLAIKGTDTTPEFLITIGHQAAWLVALLAYMVILIPLFILLGLMKKREQGLLELIFHLAGKWVGIILCACLLFIILSGAVINSRSYVDIVNTMFYPKTAISLLFFLFLTVCYFIATRGLETIGRTAWLLMFWIHLFGFVLVILVWQEMDWLQLFPILGSGPKSVLIGGARYSSIYVEIIILAAFFPYVTNYKEYRLATLGGLTISMFWIVILCAIYIMVFDYPAAVYLNFPYQQLSRFTAIGVTITHLEAVFLGLWLIAAVIHFATFLYLAAYLFARMIRIKEFEPLILPLAGVVLLLGVLPDNIVVLNHFREHSITSSSVFIILLPILLLFLDWWKGRARRVNS